MHTDLNCYTVLLCTYILSRASKSSIANWGLGVMETLTLMSLKGKWRRICSESSLTRQSRWAQTCYITRTATWILCSCNVFFRNPGKWFSEKTLLYGRGGSGIVWNSIATIKKDGSHWLGDRGVCHLLIWFSLLFCYYRPYVWGVTRRLWSICSAVKTCWPGSPGRLEKTTSYMLLLQTGCLYLITSRPYNRVALFYGFSCRPATSRSCAITLE